MKTADKMLQFHIYILEKDSLLTHTSTLVYTMHCHYSLTVPLGMPKHACQGRMQDSDGGGGVLHRGAQNFQCHAHFCDHAHR